jgi:hypothetical protein
MRTLEQVVEMIRKWHRSDTVGTFSAYRYPGAQVIEVIEETVVKKDEMPEEVAAAFELFMDYYRIDRGEVFRNNKTGKPDRVKFARRADV